MTNVAHLAAVFEDTLLKACAAVSKDSFHFEVAGDDDISLKERAYCYELHHRVKTVWPPGLELSLHPEIPKKAHPILAQCVGDVSPDFILHRPKSMEKNCVVMEVKSAEAISGRWKDWETLRRFLTCGQYYAGHLLVFGEISAAMTDKLVNEAHALDDMVPGRAGVILHRAPGESGHLLYP